MVGYPCQKPTNTVALTGMSTWNPNTGGPEPRRRRSQRVMLRMSITVLIESGLQGAVEEQTQTLVVNAHGALIELEGKVVKGQRLRLTNRATRVEQDCRVMHLGPTSGGKAQVGVEFVKPSPDFWSIAFPPEDWTTPEQEPVTNTGE